MNSKARIAVFGYLRFPPERIKDIFPHVHDLVEATNRLDGCILYRVFEDPFEPGMLRFSELWPDQASLDRHIAAPHVPPWREAVQRCGMLERHYSIFDITGERNL